MLRFSIAIILYFVAGLGSVSAVLVDWGTLTWTAGTLTNSYDIDPGNAGNDVTVTVSGDTAQLQPSLASGNPQTPAITRAFDGGFSPGPSTLELAANYTTNTQGFTVTVTFAAGYTSGVANLSLSLFDIDFANAGGNTYQDLIRSISATSATGTPIAPVISALGSNVSLGGSGLTQTLTGTGSNPDLGVGSGTGNATITFNATDIRSITFTYGSTTMFANPTYQHIGIDDIMYSVVPETDPGWLSLFFCISIVTWSTVGQRRLCPQRK